MKNSLYEYRMQTRKLNKSYCINQFFFFLKFMKQIKG